MLGAELISSAMHAPQCQQITEAAVMSALGIVGPLEASTTSIFLGDLKTAVATDSNPLRAAFAFQIPTNYNLVLNAYSTGEADQGIAKTHQTNIALVVAALSLLVLSQKIVIINARAAAWKWWHMVSDELHFLHVQMGRGIAAMIRGKTDGPEPESAVNGEVELIGNVEDGNTGIADPVMTENPIFAVKSKVAES